METRQHNQIQSQTRSYHLPPLHHHHHHHHQSLSLTVFISSKGQKMCSLSPMFPIEQQEWYSASEMEYPWLQSQFDSLSSPSLQYLPSFLYPCFDQSNESKNINMSLNHSNGTNSNSNNDQGTVMEKKLNHNASERDRRRKLNTLYSSLRALLPPSDQKRKLSIPMTVERVVKYIPELKQELQRLSLRKEELLKRISRKIQQEELRSKAMMDSLDSSSQQIATNWLTDTEVAVQIATSKWTSISDMLLRLEENELDVISLSSSVSSTGTIFYTLHLQMRGDCKVRIEELINGIHLGLSHSQ